MNDPLLTVKEAAALASVTPASWRSLVRKGYAPAPDVPDTTSPANRSSPRWKTSTVDAYRANRRQGRRTDLEAKGEATR